MSDTSARQELARRELARRKLRYFIPYVFTGFIPKPHNLIICDAVDLAIEGKITRLMINTPPQHGKSETVSRKAPPFILGRFPDKRIILTSYNAHLAQTLSRAARNLISSDAYQALFGTMSINADDPVVLSSESKSVVTWDIADHRGGLVATGVGGGITGQSADFAIIDDPVKDEEDIATSRARDALYDWYWGDLYTRLSKNAPIIVCQTRWHEEDLSGRLLKEQDQVGEKWYVLRLTAVAETSDEIEKWANENYVDEAHMLTREIIDELSRPSGA